MESTSIITCIEAGPLETQVVMLAESLRSFGGEWSKTDMITVKPRRGPTISKQTRNEFRRLNVHLVEEDFNHSLVWWDHANKSATMAGMETRVRTQNITWMDSDMIVLQALDNLAPNVGSDFIARAGEGYLGSDGADETAAFWNAVCDSCSLQFPTFPLIVSFPEQRPIRAYWQGGIYTYSASIRLGQMHYAIMKRLMDEGLGSKRCGVFFQDQVSLALAVQRLGLTHSEFQCRMNYNLNYLSKDTADILPIGQIKILHYHGSLWPANLDWTMTYLEKLPPDRLELIRKYAPFSANLGPFRRAQRKLLHLWRQRHVEDLNRRAILY